MHIKKAVNKTNRELFAEAQEKLDEVMDLLKPCFETISQPELWAQEKINPETIEFLILSHEIADKFPDMFPDHLNMDVFDEEILNTHELRALAGKTYKLNDNVSKMLNLSGNLGLEIALPLYNNIKVAANHDLPGAELLFDKLKSAYRSKKRSKKSRK